MLHLDIWLNWNMQFGVFGGNHREVAETSLPKPSPVSRSHNRLRTTVRLQRCLFSPFIFLDSSQSDIFGLRQWSQLLSAPTVFIWIILHKSPLHLRK
jgi:hypothetical protein